MNKAYKVGTYQWHFEDDHSCDCGVDEDCWDIDGLDVWECPACHATFTDVANKT
jgi:hypothetical protein